MKEVSETPVRGDEIEWAPDGQKLIFTTLPTGFTVESYLRTLVGDPSTERQAQTDHANDTVVLYAAQAAKSNAEATSDPWNLDLFLRDLREVDAATGQTRTLVEAQELPPFTFPPTAEKLPILVLSDLKSRDRSRHFSIFF